MSAQSKCRPGMNTWAHSRSTARIAERSAAVRQPKGQSNTKVSPAKAGRLRRLPFRSAHSPTQLGIHGISDTHGEPRRARYAIAATAAPLRIKRRMNQGDFTGLVGC